MKTSFLFLMLCLSGTAMGQSTGLLSGRITDEYGEPIIGATVKVFQDGNFINGVVSDYDGIYALKLAPGIYQVEVSSVGYSSFKRMSLQVGFEKSTEYNPVLFECVGGPVPIVVRPSRINMTPGNTGQVFDAEQLKRF